MQDDFLLIGIDGGATKVNGWSIDFEDNGRAFTLGDINVIKSYREIDGYIENFKPVDLNLQLNEWEAGQITPTDQEMIQSNCYIGAASRSIIKIAECSGKKRVLIGIGMPGIKTKDERGIAVLKNGPRMIDYAARIEHDLQADGVELVQPISHIGSDAYNCGIGEEYASDGSFRQERNSYYLGGGTGAADALKLHGHVIPLDETKGWFVKAWEMKCPSGFSVERYVSSQGIQSIYSELVGKSLDELNKVGIFPPQIRARALSGEEPAVKTMQTVAHFMALLMYERITSLYAGWQGVFGFVNPNRPTPSKEHNFKKVLFDSLIIGQRLGDLLRESKGDMVLWAPFVAELTELITASPVLERSAREHYCPGGRLDLKRIKISNLREAPALGAGIDAYLTWKGKNHA